MTPYWDICQILQKIWPTENLSMDEQRCQICFKMFQQHSRKIKCNICLTYYHLKCITVCSEYLKDLSSAVNDWFCTKCITDLFPYNHLENDVEYYWPAMMFQSQLVNLYITCLRNYVWSLNWTTKITPHFSWCRSWYSFYNTFNQSSIQCNYYLETTFNDELEKTVEQKMCYLCAIWISEVWRKT